MIFPTASLTKRPIRLSEEIRDWAWRSMHGEYGDEALRHMSVSLDDIDDFVLFVKYQHDVHIRGAGIDVGTAFLHRQLHRTVCYASCSLQTFR